MFDPERRDAPEGKGSLLALAGAPRQGESPAGGRSRLAEAIRAAEAKADSRRARTSAPARKSPLLSALASARPSGEEAQSGSKAEADGRTGRPAVPAERRAAMQPPPSAEQWSAEDDYWKPLIDPMKVIGGVARSGSIIVATTILGAAVGAMIALSTPKKYRSTAEIVVDPRELRIVQNDLTAGGLPSDATLALVENQVRILTSGSVLNTVVDKLGLDRDPEFNGDRKSGGIGGIVSSLRALLSGGGAGDGADRSKAIAVESLYEALDVERGGKTFVVSVAATTESPDKSALIANTLTEVYLRTYGDIQSGTAGRAESEITSRLEELRAGVEEAERKVEAFKAQNDIIDAQGRLITDDEMVKLNDQLSIARARTLELNAKAESARGLSIDAVLAGDLPEQVSSPVLTELRTQFSTLRQEADRVGAKLGPRHPERVAIDAQLAAAREEIQNELRLVGSSIQVELRRAVQLEQELAARLAQLKARQAGLSEELVTLRELERGAAAKRAVYEAFLLRARETGEQKDMNTANVSVISKAMPALEPTGMSRTTMTLLATMLGFAAGVGIGGVRGAVESLRDNASGGRRRRQAAPAGVVARSEPAAPQPEPVAQRAAPVAAAPVPESPARPEAEKDQSEAAAAAATAPEAQMQHVRPNGYPTAYPQQPDAYAPPPAMPQAQPPQGAYPGYPPGYPDPQAMAYWQQQAATQQYQPYPAPAQPGWQGMPSHPQQAPAGYPYPPQAYQPAPWMPQQMQPQPYAQYPQPAPAPAQPAPAAADAGAIEEIRASLREFREALKGLAAQRGRRLFP